MSRRSILFGSLALIAVLVLPPLAPSSRAQTPPDGNAPAKPPDQPQAQGKNIDLVLCLDVSNSMDHLIDSAKQKLWDIVNDLAKVKPTPRLRVGLYSYGHSNYDAQKGWVRKELDFVDDLDLVFQKLFALKTHGGDEYVARVCRDAMRDLKWSKENDALKILFVCGNEPAAQDPTLKLADIADLAAKSGINLNTIYCGGADDNDGRDWRELAGLAGGRFANIDQSKNVRVTIATPFDKDIAALADKVNATYVPYTVEGGAKALQQKLATENSKELGPVNLAARVVTQNSAIYRNAAWDLVDKMKADPKFDITKVPDAQLCEELKKLKPQERVAYVQNKLREREAIQKQVETLNAKREAHIRVEMQKQASDPNRGFDRALRTLIREQAAAKKIVVPE
jgi:hypothetical protein